jgi:UDP-glucose 6-dehydrogenase
MSPESAEITKLSINCFITMKISYANQIGDIADRTPGADKFAILRAVGADSRIGKKCVLPGYGFGGPCFPRDNRALGGYAKTVGIDAMLMKATDAYNQYHAGLMAKALADENRDVYIVEDVAYKPKCPVPIIEESQPLEVAARLRQLGKKVIIRDRPFIIREVKKEFGDLFQYEEVESL